MFSFGLLYFPIYDGIVPAPGTNEEELDFLSVSSFFFHVIDCYP